MSGFSRTGIEEQRAKSREQRAKSKEQRAESKEMPKLKTHRGAAKRFKKTATGKFKRGKAFKQHILTSKTRSRKRGLRGTVVTAAADQAKLRLMLPD